MKKIIALLMCLALVFSLAACSDNNGGANVTPDADGASSKVISRGTINGDVYTNDFIGITFTKPADWNYLSDAEIADVLNAGQKEMDLTSTEKALNKIALIYDAAAKSADGTSVYIMYENPLLTFSREVTADEYAEQINQGFIETERPTYTNISKENVTLGNADFIKLLYEVSLDGVQFTQAYYVTVIDKYVVSVILSGLTAEDITAMEAMFS